MKKVLILANHYNTLRIFRRELIIKLASLGYEVIVSIPDCDDENKLLLESYGCKVVFTAMERRGMNPVKDMGLIARYYKLLRNIKPDIVITYTIKPNIYGSLVCKVLKIPHYVNITGLGSAFQGQSKTRKLVSFMYKCTINKAEKIFFENVGNRDVLVQDGIISKDKTVVMAGAGVNLDEFPLTAYPGENEPIHFLFVGRIMKEKGVDELFAAIPEVLKQYPDAVFEFIGWYEDDYNEAVEKMKKDGLIRFYGFQSNVKPYIERAHCVILPSYHEGMSNTLLESAAMGRPLITSNIHGCMEAVKEGETGYLVQVKDKDSLTDKLLQFAALSYAEKRQMGEAGRKHMEEQFDKKVVVAKTLQVIRRNLL